MRRRTRQIPDTDILAPYLNDRRKYVLLARMLSFPAAADEEAGRNSCPLSGPGSRTDGGVCAPGRGGGGGIAGRDGARGYWNEILSGDSVRIVDALDRFAAEEPDPEDPKHRDLRQKLLQAMEDPQRPVKERFGAGNALSILGDPRDFAEMLPVPAGEFVMGSQENDRDAEDTEKPQHTIHVDAFAMGKYPITNSQYAQFVAARDDVPPGGLERPGAAAGRAQPSGGEYELARCPGLLRLAE